MFASDLPSRLQQLEQQAQYRRRQIVESPQGAYVELAGNRLLNFSSNDYLGLANHPQVLQAFKQGADNYGVGSGSAHLICGHGAAHHALEEELAEFTGFDRVLLFSTGYMANLGVISALVGRGDCVFEDRLNHASLLDGARLSGARFKRYRHSQIDQLSRYLGESGGRNKLVVTEGVFSMDGDLGRVGEIAPLCQTHNTGLLLDDAHGIGVLGERGRGTLELKKLTCNDVTVMVGTLGKAFGTFGAFAAGNEAVIEYLIQRARPYIYTTALPPGIAAATRKSLQLVQSEHWRREKLFALIQRFRDGAKARRIPLMESHTPIQPIPLGASQRALDTAGQLRRNGIFVMPIRPPTVPSGSARLRITLSALHQEEHIDRLLNKLADVFAADGV